MNARVCANVCDASTHMFQDGVRCGDSDVETSLGASVVFNYATSKACQQQPDKPERSLNRSFLV